jgi:hypothetical protein
MEPVRVCSSSKAFRQNPSRSIESIADSFVGLTPPKLAKPDDCGEATQM